jgi:hypothetical protein
MLTARSGPTANGSYHRAEVEKNQPFMLLFRLMD